MSLLRPEDNDCGRDRTTTPMSLQRFAPSAQTGVHGIGGTFGDALRMRPEVARAQTNAPLKSVALGEKMVSTQVAYSQPHSGAGAAPFTTNASLPCSTATSRSLVLPKSQSVVDAMLPHRVSIAATVTPSYPKRFETYGNDDLFGTDDEEEATAGRAGVFFAGAKSMVKGGAKGAARLVAGAAKDVGNYADKKQTERAISHSKFYFDYALIGHNTSTRTTLRRTVNVEYNRNIPMEPENPSEKFAIMVATIDKTVNGKSLERAKNKDAIGNFPIDAVKRNDLNSQYDPKRTSLVFKTDPGPDPKLFYHYVAKRQEDALLKGKTVEQRNKHKLLLGHSMAMESAAVAMSKFFGMTAPEFSDKFSGPTPNLMYRLTEMIFSPSMGMLDSSIPYIVPMEILNITYDPDFYTTNNLDPAKGKLHPISAFIVTDLPTDANARPLFYNLDGSLNEFPLETNFKCVLHPVHLVGGALMLGHPIYVPRGRTLVTSVNKAEFKAAREQIYQDVKDAYQKANKMSSYNKSSVQTLLVEYLDKGPSTDRSAPESLSKLTQQYPELRTTLNDYFEAMRAYKAAATVNNRDNIDYYYISHEVDNVLTLERALPLALKAQHLDMHMLWSAASFGSRLVGFYQKAPAALKLKMYPIFAKTESMVQLASIVSNASENKDTNASENKYTDAAIEAILEDCCDDPEALEAVFRGDSTPCYGSF